MKVGGEEAIILKALLDLLKDEDSFVRYYAAQTLGKLGKSDTKIQSALMLWIEQNSDRPNIGSAINILWQTCA
jgi:HEAT repeat